MIPCRPSPGFISYTAPDGKTQGHLLLPQRAAPPATSSSEGLRRIVVNAALHLTRARGSGKGRTSSYVDPFYPSFYGFIRDKGWYKKLDLQAEDFGLGKTPHVADPPGSPSWDFRPVPKK